jgi:hypothetical protein
MSGGEVLLGTQMTLLFDDSSITEARMHQYLSYTNVSATCEVGDIDNWATDSLYFAGISFTRYPYKAYSELLESPYTAEDWTIELDDYEGEKKITVLNQCLCLGLAGEDVTSGQGIMMSDEADHSSDTHDGMFGVNDAGSTAAEMYATIGIARTNSTVPASHDNHSFDKDDLDETAHPSFEMLLWR